MVGGGESWLWWRMLALEVMVFIGAECTSEDLKIFKHSLLGEERPATMNDGLCSLMQRQLNAVCKLLNDEKSQHHTLDRTRNPGLTPSLLGRECFEDVGYYALVIISFNLTENCEMVEACRDDIMDNFRQALEDKSLWQFTAAHERQGSSPLLVSLFITKDHALVSLDSDDFKEHARYSLKFTAANETERSKRENLAVLNLPSLVNTAQEAAINDLVTKECAMVRDTTKNAWKASWSSESIELLGAKVKVTITYFNRARAVVFSPLSYYVAHVLKQPVFESHVALAMMAPQSFHDYSAVRVAYTLPEEDVGVAMDIEYLSV